MGGKVGVKSELGKGTQFNIILRTSFKITEESENEKSRQRVMIMSKLRDKNEIHKKNKPIEEDNPINQSMEISFVEEPPMMSQTEKLGKSINRMKQLNQQLVQLPNMPPGADSSGSMPDSQQRPNNSLRGDYALNHFVIDEMPEEEAQSIHSSEMEGN